MARRPTETIIALKKLCKMNALRDELIIMHAKQAKPIRKYYIVISLFSSRTFTASFALLSPSLPLRNLPTPKTLQVAEFKIAQSSNPIAHAVIDK